MDLVVHQEAHSYPLRLWNPKAPRHSGASTDVALSMQQACPDTVQPSLVNSYGHCFNQGLCRTMSNSQTFRKVQNSPKTPGVPVRKDCFTYSGLDAFWGEQRLKKRLNKI